MFNKILSYTFNIKNKWSNIINDEEEEEENSLFHHTLQNKMYKIKKNW